MRKLTPLMIAAVALQGVLPAAAVAQPRGDRYAVEACGRAVQGEVENRYPQAYSVVLLERNPTPTGRDETQVTGKGEFQDRNGGAARFSYGCTYSARSGATYALDVRDVRPVADPDKKKDNSAAIAGLVLGAIIVGAIAAGSDKDHDRDRDRRDWDRRGTFSPADGVRCNRREATCYKDGRYSEKWTRRVFVN